MIVTRSNGRCTLVKHIVIGRTFSTTTINMSSGIVTHSREDSPVLGCKSHIADNALIHTALSRTALALVSYEIFIRHRGIVKIAVTVDCMASGILVRTSENKLRICAGREFDGHSINRTIGSVKSILCILRIHSHNISADNRSLRQYSTHIARYRTH